MGLNLGERTQVAYVVILRIYIGGYLLSRGIAKYRRGFPDRPWLDRQIGKPDELSNLFDWYKDFLINIVSPNQELFGYLVTYGEILIGLCLVIGLLTRFASAMGILMFINYVLGPGMARGGSTLGQTQIYLVSMIVFFLTNPGRTLGLDGFLFGRRYR